MLNNKKVIKGMLIVVMALLITIPSLIVFALSNTSANVGKSSYVEIYSPTKDATIHAGNPESLSATVKDSSITPSGKGLVLDYKPGANAPVSVTLETGLSSVKDFKGLAMWLDIPASSETYSFTMFVENQPLVWNDLNLGTELTLIHDDGTIEVKNSLWKRFDLNGFRGWLLLPQEAYKNFVPDDDNFYNLIFMIEYSTEDGFIREEATSITIGSIGYYTDYVGALYDLAGNEAMVNKTLNDLDGYIESTYALNAKNERQLAVKNEMLVYFSNLRKNFHTLSADEQVKITKNLYDEYFAYMEDFLYGDIRKTNYVMSFALMSDTHFSETWINERFLHSLDDAVVQKPDLTAAFVLGDISNEGVSVNPDPDNKITTELDNYYDWLDSYEYKNGLGNDVPIINIMGNHDYRGHSKQGYPTSSYQPAVDMYLEREPLAKEAGSINFDTWINGYHFIFLNSDEYHSDDCHLKPETIEWLDEKLSENEDGRPIFVMVHQNKDRVIAMEGSSMTFEEVIAKHPSAIVSSGHAHSPFGYNEIIQEGKGTYINQPAMVLVQEQYYIVEVYEGGVIYRAREVTTDSWLIENDVAVMNEDMSNNVIFDSKTADISTITPTNATAQIVSYDSVSGNALKLAGATASEDVLINIAARGNNSNYAGYALFMNSTSPVKLKFDDVALKSEATYYSVVNGKLVEKKTSANGEVEGSGWIVIPKDAISGSVNPSRTNVLSVTVSDGQTIYLDKVSYYFDIDDFVNNISNLSYIFINNDEIYAQENAEYGSVINVPANPTLEDTDEFTYEFVGWDIDGDGVADELPATLKGNLVANAIYEAVVRQYTYTLYAADGETVLKEATVDYGTSVVVPDVDGLYGWDIDGDGAVESLPKVVTGDFDATAVLGLPKYENAEVIFDPSILSTISFSAGRWGGPTTPAGSGNALPVVNTSSPTGKVAQFTYNYTAEHTQGTHYIDMAIPYNGTYEGFQGYAIWVDVAATEEEYTGNLCVNGQVPWGTQAWTLISVDGTVTTGSSTSKGQGLAFNLGKGFTGWVIFDKGVLASDQSTTLYDPSSTGKLHFRLIGGNRTSSFTMSIGEIIIFGDKAALVAELSDTTKAETLEYSFNDGNGYIYKEGQITEGEAIIVPADPIHENEEVFFAGWDTNGDGTPDELPADGKITESLNAVAIFYHIDGFDTINGGVLDGWTTENANITKEKVEHEGSPTGSAVKFGLNTTGEAAADSVVYARLALSPSDEAVGIAFYLDASEVSSFGFRVFKNWIPKYGTADNGCLIYLYGNDGSVTASNTWRKLIIPDNFEGWVVMPLQTFASHKEIVKGDILRLGICFGQDGTASDFSGNIYIGEAVTYNCPTELFINQIDKQVYGFMDWDGSFVSTGIVTSEAPFVAPANPVREGWIFEGWDIDGDGIADELPASIERGFKATAIYNREFTYKFIDQDGNVLLERNDEYNSLILPPFRYGADDPNYEYSLTYVDFENGMLLTEDVTFTVNVNKVPKKYTITFVDEAGNVLQEEELSYGDTPVYNGETPSKESTAQYSYQFNGWDKELVAVSDNTTYTVVFEEILNQYKVTFLSDDNETVLDEQVVDYGTTPVYAGNTPTKAETNEFKYVFKGWDKEISAVTGEVTYVAVFETINKYKVTFLLDDNKTVLDEQIVAEGEVPVYKGSTPTKASTEEYKYTFKGWNKEIVAVTGNVTYVAVFDEEPINGHEHDFTGEWSKDDNKHWKECSCGEKSNEGNHEHISIVIKEATTSEEGLVEYKCSVCGHSYTQTIAKKESTIESSGCSCSVTGTALAVVGLLGITIFVSRKKRKEDK